MNNVLNRTKSYRGAIIEENVAALYLLFIFLFLPMMDLATMGLRSFFFWFACEQAAMAGAKGNVYSNTAYPNNSFTVIPTQATNAATSFVNGFSGITMTQAPVIKVIAQAIPNTAAATINPYVPVPGQTFLDKSLYVPILEVTMTGQIQPFITVPFLPIQIPGLNQPFNITVTSDQQIENPSALSY